MAERNLYTREQLIERFKRSYKIAQPDADTSSKGQPHIDARVAADMQLPLYASAQAIGDASTLDARTDEELDAIGEAEGVRRPPAAGASGFLVARTAVGGSTIIEGDEAVYPPTGTRYRVLETALYENGEEQVNPPVGSQVPVIALDVGPNTDLPAGAVLEWVNPRPGSKSDAAVWSEGLTGGRDQATPEEYKALIRERRKSPASAGNDAQYQSVVEDPFAHGVAVQKAFTYPACQGTGTCGVAFLMRPSIPGGSRLPSSIHLALVGAALENSFPTDDGIFLATVAEQATKVAFRVSWKKSASGWASVLPWPAFISGAQMAVSNAVAITSSGFRVATSGTSSAPIVGQSIALYDASEPEPTARFKRKTIATVTEVTAGKVWDLTFDMTAGLSDSFVPANGALISPWSDSLNLLVAPVVGYFDKMGTGEMVSAFYDPGRRQRRQPESPESWTSEVGNQLDARVQAVSAVRSGTLVVPSSTLATAVGVNGVLVYVRRLTDMAVYAED
jgi:uncharacterized phage protein gp47/JayE